MATEKAPDRERLPNKTPLKRGAYLEMTLMNFDDWGAVNFFAIIIGH
jgi:hypothetical protein